MFCFGGKCETWAMQILTYEKVPFAVLKLDEDPEESSLGMRLEFPLSDPLALGQDMKILVDFLMIISRLEP